MMTGRDLVSALEGGPPAPRSYALSHGLLTYFSDLDHLLGGLRGGQLWCITGDPGVGRSVLAAQLAGLWAGHWADDLGFVSPEDAPRLVAARLVASQFQRPMTELLVHRPQRSPGPHEQVIENLRRQPIRFTTEPEELETMLQEVEVVIVDDGDLVEAAVPGSYERLHSWCRATGGAAVVTLPRDEVLAASRRGLIVDQRWSRWADVVMEIQRPDAAEQLHARAGEADIIVRRNRTGPTDTIAVAFQGHYARFVDMPGHTGPAEHPTHVTLALPTPMGEDDVDYPFGRDS